MNCSSNGAVLLFWCGGLWGSYVVVTRSSSVNGLTGLQATEIQVYGKLDDDGVYHVCVCLFMLCVPNALSMAAVSVHVG